MELSLFRLSQKRWKRGIKMSRPLYLVVCKEVYSLEETVSTALKTAVRCEKETGIPHKVYKCVEIKKARPLSTGGK